MANLSESSSDSQVELKDIPSNQPANKRKVTQTGSVVLEFGEKDTENKWAHCFTKPKNPILLEWKDIDFKATVSDGMFPCTGKRSTRHILKGCSGCAQPGEFLCIMGPSGAGKTSLLNALSNRIHGFNGEVLFNGRPRDHMVTAATSFVMQSDIFLPFLTARQTLDFSATLLTPDASLEDIQKRVDDFLVLFGLKKCENTKVGNDMIRGLSGGEKKRLNIANELLGNASLIFLDEPTSGLDSTTSLDIVSMLSMISHRNRTVVCTLHQPSSQMFERFDKILLMLDGGIVYQGDAKAAHNYFWGLGFECPKHFNPADFYLLVLQQHQIDKNSTVKDELIAAYKPALKTMSLPEPITKTKGEHSYSSNVVTQARLLFIRAWRSATFAAFFHFFMFTILAGIFAVVWWDSDFTEIGLQNRYGLIFFSIVQWVTFPMFGAINQFVPESAVVKKEMGVRAYKIWVYFLFKSLAEFLVELVTPIVFSSITYWAAGLNPEPERFFMFLFLIILLSFTSQGIGILISALANDIEKGPMLSLAFLFIGILTAGFYVDPSNIPVWFNWTQYITPFRYIYDAFVLNEFDDKDVTYNLNGTDVSGKQIVEDSSIFLDNIWYNILAVVGFCLMGRVLAFIALYWRVYYLDA